MNREIFEERYEAGWRQLESILDALERKKTPDTVGELPELYRQACHHLALARHRRYGADLEQRLNRLALRGHQQLYRNSTGDTGEIGEVRGTGGMARFIGAGFPRLVRAESRLVWLATLLFATPFLLMMIGVSLRPELALSVLPGEQVEEMGQQYAPGGNLKAGRPAESDVMMFGFYIYNNIGIAFRTFASGILFGVGSIFFLIFNGVFIGAVAGHINQVGYHAQFYPFVIGHGAFELTAIVLSGAAGLRLGLSLLSPGRLSRGHALLQASRRSVRILYGAAAMLVIAAFLEAFWSSSVLVPNAVKYSIGGALWAFVLFYFLVFGRTREP